MAYDLLVRETTHPAVGGRTNIGVTDGRIEYVGPEPGSGEREIAAGGGLLAEPFVDCHVHLDKAFIADSLPPNESGTLGEAIENIHERKAQYTVEDVRDRAETAIEHHVRNGCTQLRTHVDVDSIGGLRPLEGVRAAREACTDIANVQIVAFPQEGILKDPETEELLADALEGGADVVGGMPDNERSERAREAHADICLELADEHDVPVDMHVDETDDPNARSLEYVAARTLELGLDDVTAGHTCALAAYEENHAHRVIELLEEAEMNVVTNPPTNLLLQGRHDRHPKRRGITRVDQLREAGITVAAGQDCMQDGFYPYGRASMLETALLTAHAAHLATPAERLTAWEMVSSHAATVMGIEHGIAEGKPATFNLFPASVTSRTDALRAGRPPRTVIHRGRVVTENTAESTLHRAN
ncbi:MAG: amidohydrolase family protein [Halovenus sp.]